MKSKICGTCYQNQSLANFYKNELARDGLFKRCKACCHKYRTNKYNPIKNEVIEPLLIQSLMKKDRKWKYMIGADFGYEDDNALVVGALLTALIMPAKTVPVASVCAAAPACSPTLSCPDPIVSDTETSWKQAALDMATAEWSEKSYKDIYEVLKDIDEKEDISKVVEKDFEFESFDAFSKDAVLIQELKVYYEDEKGNDVKDYVVVETTIDNGEVDKQSISLD